MYPFLTTFFLIYSIETAVIWYGKMNFLNKIQFLNLKYFRIAINFTTNLTKWKPYPFKNRNIYLDHKKIQDFKKANHEVENGLNNCKKSNKKELKFWFFSNLTKNLIEKNKTKLKNYNCFFRNNYLLYCKFRSEKQIFNFIKSPHFWSISKHLNFKKFIANLTNFSHYIREGFLKKRKDLRKLETISTDSSGTVEFDDLIHYRFLKHETIHEIGVHITDIYSILPFSNEFFFYLKEKNRSRFFANKKSGIFPRVLSKNYFSLHQNMDRLSFSTIFLFDYNGKIKKLKIKRSIINNKRCFTDIKISKNIENFKKLKKNKKCFFSKKFILIKNICLKLKSLRLKLKGNSKFLENFKISTQHQKTKLWGNLNDELIILSNITIAEKILEFFPNCTELRRLNFLKLSNFSKFFQISICFSVKLNFSDFKKAIKDIKLLSKINQKNNILNFKIFKGFYGKNLKDDILVYNFKTKLKVNLNKINWGPLYLQTSSPIRRFDNIVVQRTLHQICLN